MNAKAVHVSMNAQPREKDATASDLRNQGLLPLNVYGRALENQHLQIPVQEFVKVFNVAGESALVDLSVNDKAIGKVLIKDVQLDPIKDTAIHADLYQIREDEKLQTEIPLIFVGEPPAVKELGGTLIKQTEKIEVRCLPKDLIHEIEVDVSSLDSFDVSLSVADINVPEEIEVLTEPTVMIAAVSEPRKVEVETPAEDQPLVGEDVKEGGEGDDAKSGEETGEGDKPAEASEEKSE